MFIESGCTCVEVFFNPDVERSDGTSYIKITFYFFTINIIIIYSVMKFINYFIIITIYFLRNIFSARITYFQGFSIKYFM